MHSFPVSGLSEELIQLAGSTLVLPAVSAGNVGELAMEILLASLPTRLVAILENQNVLPCVGNDPLNMSNPGTMSSALELFEVMAESTVGTTSGKLYLLQQRSPAMLGRQAAFATELVEWAQLCGVARLMVLSGLDSSLRKDRQIAGPSARFLASDAALTSAAEAQGLQQVEEEYLSEERQAHGLLPPWPLLAAASGRGLPHLLLGCFASEGDNVPHALQVAGSALCLMSSGAGNAAGASPAPAALRIPCSFAALYGRTSGVEAFFG